MKNNQSKSPEFEKESFECPHCEAFAQQKWRNDEVFLREILISEPLKAWLKIIKNSNTANDMRLMISEDGSKIQDKILQEKCEEVKQSVNLFPNYCRAQCLNCKNISVWVDKKMVYPLELTAPSANEHMPPEVKKIYDEARSISNLSPRAAAALLRVALEKLTEYLGEKKGNLNTRIKNLKQRDLPEKVIKSLDILRVNGNEGAHAGQIDLENKDNSNIVAGLFRLVNIVVRNTIEEDKEVDTFYKALPEDKKEGIKNRDNN